MLRYYAAVIHKEPDSDYGVSFPDFPGCVAAGGSQTEALAAAREALELHLRGMLDDSETVPDATPVDALTASQLDGGTAALVGALVPSRIVRVNVTIDENALQEIDAFAKAEGETRSGFLAKAADAYMRGQLERRKPV